MIFGFILNAGLDCKAEMKVGGSGRRWLVRREVDIFLEESFVLLEAEMRVKFSLRLS